MPFIFVHKNANDSVIQVYEAFTLCICSIDTDSLNDHIYQTENLQTTMHYICEVAMMYVITDYADYVMYALLY